MRQIFLGFFSSVIVYLIASLAFFVPKDKGWAYEDTLFQGVYCNKLGACGAWSSSFLVYYMGGAAAWIFLCMWLTMGFYAYKGYSSRALFSLCVQYFVILFTVLTYAAFSNCDYVPCIAPGGVFGQWIKQLIHFLGDPTVEHIVISFLWMISLSLIFPFRYVRLHTKAREAIEHFYKLKGTISPKKKKRVSLHQQKTIEELLYEVTMQKNE